MFLNNTSKFLELEERLGWQHTQANYLISVQYILSFTYPSIIHDGNVSILLNKVSHHIHMAFLSCLVQGCILNDRNQHT